MRQADPAPSPAALERAFLAAPCHLVGLVPRPILGDLADLVRGPDAVPMTGCVVEPYHFAARWDEDLPRLRRLPSELWPVVFFCRTERDRAEARRRLAELNPGGFDLREGSGSPSPARRSPPRPGGRRLAPRRRRRACARAKVRRAEARLAPAGRAAAASRTTAATLTPRSAASSAR
jgi:hypothetical protein